MDQDQIDPRIYDLYDEYCHSQMERREFLRRAAAITVIGGSGLAMAQALLPRYAEAQMVSFTDERIKAHYVTYDSPGGNAAKIKAYLVQPKGSGPFPSVLVVHENRGLNPHIEDIARRVATEGFLALAPDALSAIGGYPGNDDDGKKMQRSLDRGKTRIDMLNGAKWLRKNKLSNGKLGVVGFCFGGSVVNWLATQMGGDLQAAVPFYGTAPKIADVPKIQAALLCNYAENDKRVNSTRPAYEAALKKAGKKFEMYTYPGTRHGFNNNSTKRYNAEQAKIAWDRTIAFFKKNLG